MRSGFLKAYLSLKPPLQQNMRASNGHKQGRPAYNAGQQGRWASLKNMPALTVNIFVAVTNITNTIVSDI
jgi:hypothetical protein